MHHRRRIGQDRRVKENLKAIELEKIALKEAFKETFDAKLKEFDEKFGRWSRKTLTFLLFCACLYFILVSMGWHLPHD